MARLFMIIASSNTVGVYVISIDIVQVALFQQVQRSMAGRTIIFLFFFEQYVRKKNWG